MVNIEEIIDEVVKELEIGIVKTEVKYRMKIHSHYNSHFENTPTLKINDKLKFYENIKNYVLLLEKSYSTIEEKRDHFKRIIALLFANMSLDDFINPEIYVKRRIDFLESKFLRSKEPIYISSFDSHLSVNIKPYSKETPFCFECSFISQDGEYQLPTISYGVSNGVCYIYAIQNQNKHNITPYYNKIKRKLYKLNDKVYENESLEYKNYKEGIADYYPENISDVSPSAILALTIFLNEIEKNGINKVKVIPYLPVRYENKIQVLAYKTLERAKKEGLNFSEKQKLYLDLINEQNKIQSNITEKFIRTFYRVAHHFDNVEITSMPMELDDGLHLTVNTFEYSDNEILNEVINCINVKKR